MIGFAAHVLLHEPLDRGSADVGTRKRTRVKQYLFYVGRQLVSVPNAEMTEFLASQKKLLKPKWRQVFIRSRQPVGHPVIVRVLGFGQDFLNRAMHAVRHSIRRISDTAVSRNPAKQRIAFSNQTQRRR